MLLFPFFFLLLSPVNKGKLKEKKKEGEKE
jgi:hypothetical protein